MGETSVNEASRVVADLIQSVGVDCLDFIGGYWRLEFTADARSVYRLYSLSGRILGWIEYPDMGLRRGAKPAEAVVTRKIRVKVPSEEAEGVFIRGLAEEGVSVIVPRPAFGAWVRMGLHPHYYYTRSLTPTSNRVDPRLEVVTRGDLEYALRYGDRVIHTVVTVTPNLPTSPVMAKSAFDAWLEERGVKLLKPRHKAYPFTPEPYESVD